MFADLLYNLTARDEQSLLLEVRDFFGPAKTFAAGISSQRQSAGIVLPQGRVGLVLGAQVILAPAAVFTSSLSVLGLIAAAPGGVFAGIAEKSEQTIAPVALSTYYVPLMVNHEFLLLENDDIQISIGSGASLSANIDVTAHVRVLLMPRGNVGV